MDNKQTFVIGDRVRTSCENDELTGQVGTIEGYPTTGWLLVTLDNGTITVFHPNELSKID